MRFRISHLKAHMTCPQFAHFQYVEEHPRSDSLSLGVGELWHASMALRLDPTDERARHLQELCATLPSEALNAYEAIAPAAALWRPPPEWRVTAVERELELPLGDHTLTGTPDAVVFWNDSYWHLQHKTLGPSTPVHVYSEQQRTDWHECAYQRMLEHAGYQPFSGTILNLCRKLSAARIALHPEHALSIQYMARSDHIVERALSDMERIIRDITSGAPPIRNRSACAGAFRNKLCDYKHLCDA